jgi:hypothetical protein
VRDRRRGTLGRALWNYDPKSCKEVWWRKLTARLIIYAEQTRRLGAGKSVYGEDEISDLHKGEPRETRQQSRSCTMIRFGPRVPYPPEGYDSGN